jgi:predicted GIY-YIG superfamily endonuclease
MDAEHFYTGITDNLDARLSKHNAGEVTNTAKYRTWRIKSYVAFADEGRAFAFERALVRSLQPASMLFVRIRAARALQGAVSL